MQVSWFYLCAEEEGHDGEDQPPQATGTRDHRIVQGATRATLRVDHISYFVNSNRSAAV